MANVGPPDLEACNMVGGGGRGGGGSGKPEQSGILGWVWGNTGVARIKLHLGKKESLEGVRMSGGKPLGGGKNRLLVWPEWKKDKKELKERTRKVEKNNNV